MNFLLVALGGALGAVARYAISLIPVKTYFPILTLITNIVYLIIPFFSGRQGCVEVLPHSLHFPLKLLICLRRNNI